MADIKIKKDVETSGSLDKGKGRVKKAWGDLTGDSNARAKGNVDIASGRLKEGIGRMQRGIKNALTPRRSRKF